MVLNKHVKVTLVNQYQILTYLKTFGRITDVKARDMFGTNKCPEYIRRLREKGYNIETVWKHGKNRYGRKVRYGEYVLK